MEQGEQARHCKAFVVKANLRRSGGCAGKDRVLTWGDLVSRLKGRRSRERSEKSAEAVVVSCRPMRHEATDEGPNEKEGWIL